MLASSLIVSGIALVLLSMPLAAYFFRGTPWRWAVLAIYLPVIMIGALRRGIMIAMEASWSEPAANELTHEIVVLWYLAVVLVAGIVATHLLIRRAELQLFAQEEEKRRYDELVGMSGIIVWEADSQGFFTHVGEVAGEVLGFEPDQLIGKRRFFDLVAVEDASRSEECGQRILRERTSWREQERLVLSKDGTRVWLSSTGAPMYDEVGELLGFRGMDADVTEKKRLEDILARARRISSMEEMARGVAHDFQTHLTLILGYVELAREHGAAGPQLEYLDKIKKAAGKSVELTRQILTFARGQSSSPRRVDLNRAVPASLSVFDDLLPDDVELSFSPDSSSPHVEIDPVQLEQVLANLLSNARDAMEGGGRVTVATTDVVLDEAFCASYPGVAPGDFVMLSVADEGRGMEAGTLSRVFEPFFSTKAPGKGTGLGLATVHGIVRQNGGLIEAESAPGEGTTFRLYLPRLPPAPAPSKPAPSISGDGDTVLLVEDDEDLLGMLALMLTSLGYRVITACSAREALEKADSHGDEVGLLVSDIVMPEMNGYEMASRLRARHPNLRVLLMSGHTEHLMVEQGLLDDSVHFMQKTFSMDGLGAKVRELLAA